MGFMKKKDELICLKKITFQYAHGQRILEDLDFTFFKGDRIGIVAPNGSGKTTFFHIIMGLLKPTSGIIEIFGRHLQKEDDFTDIRKRIGLLFQDADDQLFSPTVLEDVAFGPLNLGKSKSEAIAISKDTLAFLGMNGFEDRITFKLSGGEKRLISLATILSMKPDILLLDEPSTGLDESTKEKLIEVLNRLSLSYIIISHEKGFLSSVTESIYTMENGKILKNS